MCVFRVKLAALIVIFLAAAAAGQAGQTPASQAGKTEVQGRRAGALDLRRISPQLNDASLKPAQGRMFVVGRVLDPQGKPVPGARIAVYARSLTLDGRPFRTPVTQIPIGNSRADESGRFRIEAVRTSSSRYEAFGVVAIAPGHGIAWASLDPDDVEPTATITLRAEQVVQGRLFDLQGRPVPGVTLSVASIRRILPQVSARTRSRFDGVAYSWSKVVDFPAWPEPVKTDAEGRYTLRGLGEGLSAALTVHHPGFALQRILVETKNASESKRMTAALLPAQIITGRVTYADSGKGVSHAPLELTASQGRVAIPSEFETDAEGRFRLNPPPADRTYGVWAYPPEGEPYLIARKSLEWPKGAIEQSIEIALPRGILIHGKVTEEGSGKPVAGASVHFILRRGEQNRENTVRPVITGVDGSFQFGAVSGPGHIFVKAPGDDYVLKELGARMVEQGEPGGRRVYSPAFRALDLKASVVDQRVDFVLRRGVTVTGQLAGPDGQPVRDAWIFSRLILDSRQDAFQYWNGLLHRKLQNGKFDVRGLDPDSDTDIPLYFLDPKRKLGGVVSISGKAAASVPMTVRLEPCGRAAARVIDSGGKPVVGSLPRRTVAMVVTPGPPPFSVSKDQAGLLVADDADVSQIDPVNYTGELGTDAQGRLKLPVLIPGATYRITDWYVAARGQTGPRVRKEFTVKPGETLDLGDILIEKPRS